MALTCIKGYVGVTAGAGVIRVSHPQMGGVEINGCTVTAVAGDTAELAMQPVGKTAVDESPQKRRTAGGHGATILWRGLGRRDRAHPDTRIAMNGQAAGIAHRCIADLGGRGTCIWRCNGLRLFLRGTWGSTEVGGHRPKIGLGVRRGQPSVYLDGCASEIGAISLCPSCSIPDDHIDPRRSAFFMARSVLRGIRNGVRPC